MASRWVYVTLGVIVCLIVLGLIAITNTLQTVHYLSLYTAIKDDLAKSEIDRVEVEIRKVSKFSAFYSGPALCLTRIDEQYLTLNPRLSAILEQADPDGESVRYILDKDELISIAKILCISEGWAKDNEHRSPQWYPGLIISDTGKYWYGVDIYLN
jgi:hypothetical protein